MASLHKNRRTTLERIEKFVSRIYFTDVNLYGRIYPQQENVGKKKSFMTLELSPIITIVLYKHFRHISLGLTSR